MAVKTSKPGRVARAFRLVHRIFGKNIGTTALGLFLLYIVLTAIMYLSSTRIESYMVNVGQLSRNETYTGLVLRSEMLVQANSGGYVNYYAREGQKVHANGVVFGLSTSQQLEGESTLSQEDLAKIREEMQRFSKSYRSSNFAGTYSFKYQLEGSIHQYAGITGDNSTPDAVSASDLADENGTLRAQNAASDAVTYGNQTLNKAAAEGIVLYSKDNYIGKTVSNLTEEDFNETAYHEENLRTSEQIKTGDDVYTLITDENWSIVIPLTEKKAARLSDRTSIRVKFLKDDRTQSGGFHIIEIDGKKYAQIEFDRGLIRYVNERFLEVELVTNTASGLKIPLTSIVTKEFYAIPASYASDAYDQSSNTFIVATRGQDGKTTETIVKAAVYGFEEDPVEVGIEEDKSSIPKTYTLYVDRSAFQEGDALIDPNGGQSRFIVRETGSLEGVYRTNRGYAEFRKIEVLDQNEEYAIITKNTSYGISRYDHIVKNANRVKEEDITSY